jgi:hypothetical protein
MATVLIDKASCRCVCSKSHLQKWRKWMKNLFTVISYIRTVRKRKGDWIGHILHRYWLLKHVIEGKVEGMIEVTGRRGRRYKQLLNDVKEARRYKELEEEALDRPLWRTRFGRGYRPVVRQTTEGTMLSTQCLLTRQCAYLSKTSVTRCMCVFLK